MSGLITVKDIPCFDCGHAQGHHKPRCEVAVGDYGLCTCNRHLDPNLILILHKTGPEEATDMTMSQHNGYGYKAALAREQLDVARRRKTAIERFTVGWIVGWSLAAILSVLAIWAPAHLQFGLTGGVLFLIGGVCGITRDILYLRNKGIVLDAFRDDT